MKNVFVFLATGFEEIEAVATIDVIRRGGIKVTTVSITGDSLVTGAHSIPVKADALFEQVDLSEGDMLILPGGMPGASNLDAHAGLKEALKQYIASGKKIAAICAAPLVFGGLGLLEGKKATSYPGFENALKGATYVKEGVVVDGNITTGRGPGFAVDFGLSIVSQLAGTEKASEVSAGMLLSA